MINERNEWEVKIQDIPGCRTKDVYIYRYINSKPVDQIEHVSGSETVTISEYGQFIPPSMKLLPDQLKALFIALSEQNYSPEKEYTTGKLEATEKHLEDMRTLVFKSMRNQISITTRGEEVVGPFNGFVSKEEDE